MGQINSTRNPGRQDSTQAAAAGQTLADTLVPNGTSSLADSQLSAGRRDRRKSLRNSIVDFVRPQSSRDAGDSVARDSTESRNWWRGRRRQSKAQPIRLAEPRVVPNEDPSSSDIPSQSLVTGAPGEAGGCARIDDSGRLSCSAHDAHEVQDSTVEGPSSHSTDVPHKNRILSSKGKERSMEIPDSIAESTSEDPTPSIEPLHTGDNALPTGASDSPSTSNSAQNINSESPSHSTEECGTNGDVSASTSNPSTSQAPPTNIFRRFPPAGTLVVVQGVVHTDSAPRLAQDNETSSLDPGHLSPSSTLERPEPPIQQNVSLTSSESTAAEVSGPQTPSSSTAVESRNAFGHEVYEAQPSSASSSTETNGNPQTQSSVNGPNGADILGALLSIVSVATAATAASLLASPNGLPAPLSPPDLAAMPRTGSPVVDGSNLPSIARALASANPAAAAVIAQREREREERERNRVRSLWEGLRERVSTSRGNRLPPRTGSRSHTSAIPSIGDRINDTSLIPDSLFNELARAFNLGPMDERPLAAESAQSGLPSAEDSRDGSSNPQNTDNNETEEHPSGTFEQFLVDLQSDLRLALTRPDLETDVASTGDSSQSSESEDAGTLRGSVDGANRECTSDTHDGSAETFVTTATSQPVGESSSSGVRHADVPGTEPVCPSPSSSNLKDTTNARIVNTNSIPLRAEALESSFNSASNENSDASTHDASIAPNGSPTVGGNAARNGINWWRMYRFPAVQLTQLRQTSFGPNMLQINVAPEPPAAPVTEPADASSPSVSSTPERSDSVVPVIIVGLQSIRSRARRSPPGAFNPFAHANDGDNENIRRPGNSGRANLPNSGDSQRDRASWSSRAARAFSRLGRRGDNPTDQDNEASNSIGGARAFMIYVFGGHYPPDHQIFSESDGLNSFEALWELAEFLGHVKSPVVTDEDIERSGLELFKAESLREFGQDGRVANNCVDRCLICLDDYNPNDDLRLLTCKHAFHKTCVDRWLTTGRNNCPACRSEGVKTGSTASPTSQ